MESKYLWHIANGFWLIDSGCLLVFSVFFPPGQAVRTMWPYVRLPSFSLAKHEKSKVISPRTLWLFVCRTSL